MAALNSVPKALYSLLLLLTKRVTRRKLHQTQNLTVIFLRLSSSGHGGSEKGKNYEMGEKKRILDSQKVLPSGSQAL